MTCVTVYDIEHGTKVASINEDTRRMAASTIKDFVMAVSTMKPSGVVRRVSLKTVEKVVKELANDEWIVVMTKKTGKGSDDHISLNPRKVSEIKQYLMENK